jgi:hypothetical protein
VPHPFLTAVALAAALAGPAPAEEAAKPAPFIERSFVRFPVDEPGYRLVEANTMPGRPDYGVSLRYDVADAPGLRLDIYVYPLGRVPPARALELGLKDVEGGIRGKVADGTYGDARFDAPAVFDLTPPEAPSTPATPTDAPKPGSDEARVLETLASLKAADRSLEGRRQAITLVHRGHEEESLAYLFYRYLFLVKVRASTNSALVPAASFSETVDAAVTRLVPRIEVVNVGACGAIVIHKPRAEGDKAMQAEMTQELLGEAERVRREGCVAKPEAIDPAGPLQERMLEYPEGTWKDD